MAENRTYTVPLRRGFWKTPRYRRTHVAVRVLREFLSRHMKVEEEQVRIGQHLNEYLWERGIRNPPPRVTITASKGDDGIVRAELEGKAYKEAVKPQAKTEQPEGLKGKLQAAIGKRGAADRSEEEAAEQPAEEPSGKGQEEPKGESKPEPTEKPKPARKTAPRKQRATRSKKAE